MKGKKALNLESFTGLPVLLIVVASIVAVIILLKMFAGVSEAEGTEPKAEEIEAIKSTANPDYNASVFIDQLSHEFEIRKAVFKLALAVCLLVFAAILFYEVIGKKE